MAVIDYYQIEKDIAAQLSADARLSGVTIAVEEEPEFSEGKFVVIYLINREAPAEMQSISANQRVRMAVSYVLVCAAAGLELAAAMEDRDDLIGNVELSLMANTTFSNAQVISSYLSGGEFENSRNGDDGLFNASGEVELVVDVRGIL
jgi:hypothetical protein